MFLTLSVKSKIVIFHLRCCKNNELNLLALETITSEVQFRSVGSDHRHNNGLGHFATKSGSKYVILLMFLKFQMYIRGLEYYCGILLLDYD
jgi:hypothetical protein